MDKVLWEVTLLKWVLPPFWKGVYYRRKVFAPIGSNFFPFRINRFSEMVHGKTNEKSQKLSPLYTMAENLPSVSPLTFSTLGKRFSRRHFIFFIYFIYFFFLFFPENRFWYFMQIVSNADNFQEIQILLSEKNKKNILKCRLLKFLPRVLSVK